MGKVCKSSVFILFGAVLLVWGCTGGPLRVGVLLPETGEAGLYGQEGRRGVEIATAELKTVGGRPFEVVYADTGGRPGKAVEAFEKLLAQDVYAVLGPLTDRELQAVAPRATENERILISPAASGAADTLESTWVFSLRPSPGIEATKLAGFARRMKPPIKYMSIAWAQGTYGSIFRDEFLPAFKNQKGEVLDVAPFAPGIKEPQAVKLAHQLAGERPDGVLVISPLAADVVTISAALKKAEYSGRVFATATAGLTSVLEEAGDTTAGLCFTAPILDWDSTPESKAFAEAYRKAYNAEPTVWAAYAHDAMRVLAAALEEEPKFPKSTLGVLRRTEGYPGVGGALSFDQRGGVVRAFHICTVADGQVMPHESNGQ